MSWISILAPAKQRKTQFKEVLTLGSGSPSRSHVNYVFVLNTLTRLMPLEAKINIFGYRHPIVLIGAMYRHGNLAWIVMNRANNRLYLSAHLVADATHLCELFRDDLLAQPARSTKKYQRQSFNNITAIFKTRRDYADNCGQKLNTLPKTVLQCVKYTSTASSRFAAFAKTFEGHADVHLPKTKAIVEETKGWKVFGKTQPFSSACGGVMRAKCPCKTYETQIRTHKCKFAALSRTIMENVPSSLSPKIAAHYKFIIDYVIKRPDVRFFPK